MTGQLLNGQGAGHEQQGAEVGNEQTNPAQAAASAEVKQKSCFVVSPIGEAGSEIRRRADQVFKYIIEPTVSLFHYRADRADHLSEPGMITNQILNRIVGDDLVIADLTGRNPNVYYELAVRHAVRKPFIQLIQTGEQLPFDVAGTRTITLDHTDLDSVDLAKREIAKQVEAIGRDGFEVDSPLSISVNLEKLQHSNKPQERALSDLISVVSNMQTAINQLSRRLDRKAAEDHLAFRIPVPLSERSRTMQEMATESGMQKWLLQSKSPGADAAREVISLLNKTSLEKKPSEPD